MELTPITHDVIEARSWKLLRFDLRPARNDR